jgi:hypothetical protein
VSTAYIPVLHSTEVAHLYPQVVILIYHWVMNLIHLYRGGETGWHYEAFPKFHKFEKTRYGFRKEGVYESLV